MKRVRIALFGVIALGAILLFAWYRSPQHAVKGAYTFANIDAPVDKVWTVLTDTTAYPRWNPYITSIDGTLQPGAKIKLHEQVAGTTRSYSAHVDAFDPQAHEFQWTSSFIISALLQTSEGFEVTPIDASHSRLRFSQKSQGLLVESYWKYMNKNSLESSRNMVAALKKRCEQH